jgi:hypothetical protein
MDPWVPARMLIVGLILGSARAIRLPTLVTLPAGTRSAETLARAATDG